MILLCRKYRLKSLFMATIPLIVIVALSCHRQLTSVVLTQGFNACYERKGCCYDYYYHYCCHYRHVIAVYRYRRTVARFVIVTY